MAKEDHIEMEGEVIDTLPNTTLSEKQIPESIHYLLTVKL